MKVKRRKISDEIIADLKEMTRTLKSGIPLRDKYTVRTVRVVPVPGEYSAADVRAMRDLIGVSQPVFAQMLGVSAALVRSWECGQRKPAPIARRLLDLMRAHPSSWRAMIDAA
jgi:DNA-binding transcriptional regulator YiaG